MTASSSHHGAEAIILHGSSAAQPADHNAWRRISFYNIGWDASSKKHTAEMLAGEITDLVAVKGLHAIGLSEVFNLQNDEHLHDARQNIMQSVLTSLGKAVWEGRCDGHYIFLWNKIAMQLKRYEYIDCGIIEHAWRRAQHFQFQYPGCQDEPSLHLIHCHSPSSHGNLTNDRRTKIFGNLWRHVLRRDREATSIALRGNGHSAQPAVIFGGDFNCLEWQWSQCLQNAMNAEATILTVQTCESKAIPLHHGDTAIAINVLAWQEDSGWGKSHPRQNKPKPFSDGHDVVLIPVCWKHAATAYRALVSHLYPLAAHPAKEKSIVSTPWPQVRNRPEQEPSSSARDAKPTPTAPIASKPARTASKPELVVQPTDCIAAQPVEQTSISAKLQHVVEPTASKPHVLVDCEKAPLQASSSAAQPASTVSMLQHVVQPTDVPEADVVQPSLPQSPALAHLDAAPLPTSGSATQSAVCVYTRSEIAPSLILPSQDTPLYKALLDKFNNTGDDDLMNSLACLCIFDKLLYKQPYVSAEQPACSHDDDLIRDDPYGLGRRMEHLLTVTNNKRAEQIDRLASRHDPRAIYPLDLVFSRSDMQEVMNTWRNQPDTWMRPESQQKLREIAIQQKRHQFVQARFNTMLFELFGNKCLVELFVRYPICSAEQPASDTVQKPYAACFRHSLLNNFAKDMQSIGDSPECIRARERSQKKPDRDQPRLSKQIFSLRQRQERAQWIAQWIEEDWGNWRYLNQADQTLWYHYEDGSILREIDELQRQQSPRYHGVAESFARLHESKQCR